MKIQNHLKNYLEHPWVFAPLAGAPFRHGPPPTFHLLQTPNHLKKSFAGEKKIENEKEKQEGFSPSKQPRKTVLPSQNNQ